MKNNVRRYTRAMLAGILSFVLVLQVFGRMVLITKAETERVIIPSAETVTVGNADTNGVSDSSIVFSQVKEYNTNGGVFELFSAYSDITSILNVLYNKNGSAIVLEFTEAIDVTQYNQMAINAFMGGWSDNTNAIKVNIYGSGVSELTPENAVGYFETVGNLNKEVQYTLDLTNCVSTDGMVHNLTFRFETASAAESWLALGAFRLSYKNIDAPDEPEVPEVPYTELSLKDWGTHIGFMEGSNIYGLSGHDEVTSLDHVAISGKVNFNGSANKYLRIGGTESVKHGGIWFGNHPAGLYMTPQGIGGSGDYFPMMAVEWEALRNTEIMLRVTFDKSTDGRTWMVGVFINEANKGSYSIEGLEPGLYIGLDPGISVDMTVESPETPDIPDEPEGPDTSRVYSELTFCDWGIIDGEYIAGYGYDLTNNLTSLDGISFQGTLNFNGAQTWIRFGGLDGWAGLLISAREGVLIVDSEVSGFNQLDASLPYTNKNLFTDSFKLRLTFDYDSNNDVELGVWIDDVFQKYIRYEGMATSMGTKLLIDTADITIRDVGVQNEDEETEVSPGEQVSLPTNLTEVTFDSFGIQDGTYQYNGNLLAAEGRYASVLTSSMFSGDFYIPSGSNVDFRYGGVTANWFGLILSNTADGKLYLEGIADDVKVTNSYVFNPSKAETEFVDTWFNLKLTTEISDLDKDGSIDDVKLGVWFNDILYNNKYIELLDYAKYLGDKVGIYIKDAESSIRLKSDATIYRGIDFTLFGFTRNWEKELGLR